MKALLLKDFYVITKQMKVFLLLIILFSFMPGFSMATFAVCYAAALPFTAMAYDDRSKWNSLSRMLPYTETATVMSKYILGYFTMLGAAVIALLGGGVKTVFFHTGTLSGTLQEIGAGLLLGLVFLSVELPFVYRFGIEKGRLVFLGLCAVLGGCVGAYLGMSGDGVSIFTSISLTLLLTLVCVAVAAIHLLSIFLSIHFYKSRKG